MSITSSHRDSEKGRSKLGPTTLPSWLLRLFGVVLVLSVIAALGGCSTSIEDLKKNPTFEASSPYPMVQEEVRQRNFVGGTRRQVGRVYVIPGDQKEASLRVYEILKALAGDYETNVSASADLRAGSLTIAGDDILFFCPATSLTADGIAVPDGSTLVDVTVLSRG